MGFMGRWTNQYGSVVEIVDERDGIVTGTFATALDDSGFARQIVPIQGVARGNCLAFACVAAGPHGDMVVSYTGLLRDGKLEMLWHYAGDRDAQGEVPWWRAVLTSADTFTRD